jgi:hypothetical protein
MTTDLGTGPPTVTIADAAGAMAPSATADGDQLTERNLVVCWRAGAATADMTVDPACSSGRTPVTPDSSSRRRRPADARTIAAPRLRRQRRPRVGIVTLGELSIEREANSALGDIRAAASKT